MKFLPVRMLKIRMIEVLNIKCKSDYSVQNDESLRRHCTNESRVRKRDKKVRRDKTRAEDGERGGSSDVRWKTVPIANALSPTVDRRVRRASRDVKLNLI